MVDIAAISKAAHDVAALVYVDAVHYTPHGIVDVDAIDADLLVASAYKFFGPHTGVLYGKRAVLESVEAVKIRPAPERSPGKWETGTQSFESLAGVTATVDYLASLGSGVTRRDQLVSAMTAVALHERALGNRFLSGIAPIGGVSLYGPATTGFRAPTFAIAVEGLRAAHVATRLAKIGVFVWSGDYYAVEVMDSLGVADSGGLVRIGFVHYSTLEEVDLVVEALSRIAAGESVDDLNPPG